MSENANPGVTGAAHQHHGTCCDLCDPSGLGGPHCPGCEVK